MCNKISFNQDKKGKIYDAGGLSFSHSEISALWEMDDDKTNKYEFNPIEGLITDKEVFTPKLSHTKRVESYIKPFKDEKYFDRYGSSSKYMNWKVIKNILPNALKFRKYLKRVESIKWLSAKKKKLPLNVLNLMKNYSKLIDKKDREIIVLSLSAAESAAKSAAWSAAWILFPKRLKKRENIFEYYLKVAEAGYLIYKVTDKTIYLVRR